jgi:hypothetical protein
VSECVCRVGVRDIVKGRRRRGAANWCEILSSSGARAAQRGK